MDKVLEVPFLTALFLQQFTCRADVGEGPVGRFGRARGRRNSFNARLGICQDGVDLIRLLACLEFVLSLGCLAVLLQRGPEAGTRQDEVPGAGRRLADVVVTASVLGSSVRLAARRGCQPPAPRPRPTGCQRVPQ